MGTKKNGEPVIPKAEWSTRAHMHRKFADELLDLAKAAGAFGEALLQPTIDRHIRRSEICDELYSEVAKGRPKKAVVNKLAAMFPMLKPPPKKPGGPRKAAGVDMNALTYRVVEQRRAELAQNNTAKPTTKNAIDSINEQIASEYGVQRNKVVLGDFDIVYSAYKRGKKQAKEKGQN